jgi:uncharacterized protein YcaQ
VRSHYLPLFPAWATIARHARPARLGPGRQRQLFEYWGHEASLLPLSLYPLMRWRMAQADGRGIYRQLAQFGRERQDVIAGYWRRSRAGRTGCGQPVDPRGARRPWWDWSEEKHALEWLFAAGEVTVAGRRGFERLYDLPERVLPGDSRPAGAERGRSPARLLLHAATRWAWHRKGSARLLSPEPAQQGGAGRAGGRRALAGLSGAGLEATGLLPGTPRIPGIDASALLSPFDSLVWERSRTERLFDFRYRLEIYTPAHKRVYGYYVLPFLHRERIAARVDLRAERAGRLAVHAVHEEDGLDEEGYQALAIELRRLAGWLGLEQVQLNCPREGSRLRQALSAAPA